MQIDPEFWKSLRVRRLGLGLTDMGRRMGVHYTSVWRWEKGIATPNLENVLRMSELTGVPVRDLVRREEK